MSGSGSFSSRRLSHDAIRAPKEPVFAVGGPAIVRAREGDPARVPLTNDAGTTVVATLGDGVVVEVMAWLPRRATGALYHVRTTIDGPQEGWISAANLEPGLRPRERKPVHVASAPARAVRAKTPRRSPAAAR